MADNVKEVVLMVSEVIGYRRDGRAIFLISGGADNVPIT